ncbi:LysR family transcriptional regulator [Parasedimentitalea huanghaiensis]|uniref:LysR family transcriptional regulator n=1 Tax=Parasedimentitalea huanghaiensis TaxID=2682100 RepID=A0A6L6WKE5_9RHOB|nr:LysR family transcriptional regulator [Zongyanglinia huanghaiensis]MVO17449.1 LysR family transcriptional regulator [Zongyanglinia huanghaiensis]
MNFQQLRFVVAVAETHSFTSAADLCCVTQPALSNAIAQLEEELGGKLFDRTTRSVALTDFGQILINDIRHIIDAKSQLMVGASEYLTRDDRNVRVGISPLISDDFVAAMLSRIENLDGGLNIILSEMNKADIQPALNTGQIDFGLGPEPWDEDSLVSKPIYSEPLLYVSATQSERTDEPATLETLSGKQILLVGEDCGLSVAIRTLFHVNQIPLVEYEGKALGYSILEKWAQLGIGIALLPASKVANVSCARRLINRDGAAVSIGFNACWKPSQELRHSFAAVKMALQADAL